MKTIPTLGDFHARSRFARSTIPEEKWRQLVFNEAATTENFQEKPLGQGYHLLVSLMISAVLCLLSVNQQSRK